MSEPRENNSPFLSTLPDFIQANKIPLAFLVLGFFLIAGSVVILIADRPNVPSLVIEHSASVSADQNYVLIKVDVQGAVKKPGVVELSKNSRVQDALIKAGGYSSQANNLFISKNINLAAKLIDGQKIYIPFKDEVAENPNFSTNSSNNELTLININGASLANLEELPGVGEVTAGKIVAGRPYEKIEDLWEKKIVGKSVFEKIKDRVSLY